MREGEGRALVPHSRQDVIARDSHLVVTPPRPVPLTLKARRGAAKLAGYTFLACCAAFAGYGARDPEIRRSVDYQLTMLLSPGVSEFAPSGADKDYIAPKIANRVLHLFDGQKGPRADLFAAKMADIGDTVARGMRTASLIQKPSSEQTEAIAGAALFLSAVAKAEDAGPPPPADSAPPIKPDGQWAGLLRNASLSPEQPKALFGGLTEDEFRTRELRCMATAIYFEARDEPIKGQIAVAQVVMNRIRSPFYPKTICGVVYQGERNRHGCQFSFTCTGKTNRVNEKAEWATAVKLAKQVIAGEVWLDEVGYATHYHATYVRPDWRRELDRVTQIGGHIFYKMRPGTIRYAILNEGL